jgi:hypothetical protein
VGLIEEAPSRGDARERVWQTPHQGLMLDAQQDASEDMKDAQRELVSVFLVRDDARVRRYLDDIDREPADWFDASELSAGLLAVTADELKTLNQAVRDLFRPYTVRRRSDPPPDARRVLLVYRSFPIEPLPG